MFIVSVNDSLKECEMICEGETLVLAEALAVYMLRHERVLNVITSACELANNKLTTAKTDWA